METTLLLRYHVLRDHRDTATGTDLPCPLDWHNVILSVGRQLDDKSES